MPLFDGIARETKGGSRIFALLTTGLPAEGQPVPEKATSFEL